MMQVLHVKVCGRVQGVFFRAWTRDAAQKLGLTGWIKNCSDGAVELFAEGEKEKLRQLLEMCKRGPPAAHVANIEVTWEKRKKMHADFVVLHGED